MRSTWHDSQNRRKGENCAATKAFGRDPTLADPPTHIQGKDIDMGVSDELYPIDPVSNHLLLRVSKLGGTPSSK